MPIAAAIISDLHLGAPHSTLNGGAIPFDGAKDVIHGDERRAALLRLLQRAAPDRAVERLVILGDAIDLSHGTFPAALNEFNALLAQIVQAVTVGEVVFVPGNHDRHWWLLQCEHDQLIDPLVRGRPPADQSGFRHTTSAAGRADPPVIRGPLSALGAVPLRVAYPDYEFTVNAVRVRCTHGHLFEDLYTMLTHVLENAVVDLRTRAKRRDPEPKPTATQVRVLDAARDEFEDGLAHTLGGVEKIRSLDAYERLNAPLINLDWLLLGQTGLLDHEAIGGDIMKFRGTAPTLTQQKLRDQARDAARGLVQVIGLAVMDRLSRPKPPRRLHSYSSNVLKTFLIDELADRFADSVVEPGKTGPTPDDAAATAVRGKRIADLTVGILDYLDRFATARPNVLVVGHTHKADQTVLDGIQAFNTGSWVSGTSIPQPEARACVIHEDGSAELMQAP